MTDPEIPKEDPATWGPKEGAPAGLEGLDGSGFWVSCEDLGWPLDAMGKDAAVYVLPTPSAAYRTALREAVGGQEPEDPVAWLAFEAALPAVFARHVMTAMKGIRLQTGGPILDDTPENRELALRASSILLDRVQQASHSGPPGGDTWRECAIRFRHTLGEVNALVTAGMFQGVHPAHILREVHGRVTAAMGGGMVLMPVFPMPAPQAPEGGNDEGGGGQAN